MKPIKFEKEQRDRIIRDIQRYLSDEHDVLLGAIPSELLLAFFTERVGPYYYNQGLADAQAVFARSLDTINDAIYGLEQRELRTR